MKEVYAKQMYRYIYIDKYNNDAATKDRHKKIDGWVVTPDEDSSGVMVISISAVDPPRFPDKGRHRAHIEELKPITEVLL